MKQIQLPNEVLLKTLGYQKPTNVNKLRLLAYCLIQPVDDGVLMFNSLTCELLLLDAEETKNMMLSDYLRDNWFLVPENFDDKKFAKQFRALYQLLVPQPMGINSYTILTTTDCNAQCFYCYEKGRSRIPMTIDTANKLADLIVKNYNSSQATEKEKTVQLRWFGGEPLYNNKVIYVICQRLADAGVKYKSHMISNGYLFDETLARDAKQLWKLKDVQITLDGTEKTYNRAKAYIHKGVNAYERVLKNIDLLLANRIRVVVRMNIDMYNADDLIALSDILAERFGHSKGFSCYSHPLFEVAGPTESLRSEDRREEVYEKQKALMNHLVEKGLFHSGRAPKSVATSFCMADSGRSLLIAPTGDIGLCEHYSENEFISHLDNPDVIDKDIQKSFRQVGEDLDICTDCAYYPQCIRLKKCPEGSLCFPQIKEQHIDEMKKSMIVTYERWQKKQSDETSSDSEEIDDTININC